MPNSMVNPGRIFEELHGELAASLAACRARPDRQAVHSLRTTARRLEALLRMMRQGHPRAVTLRHRVKKALRPLKNLRRVAGPVRDMDVQRALVATIAETLGHSEPKRKRLEVECRQLDEHLRHRRKRLAAALASSVRDSEQELEEAFEAVRGGVRRLPETSLLETARGLAVQSSTNLTDMNRESLHRYRKQTKAARYLAEMENKSAPAKRLATKIKGVLDAIGLWHDWMLLAQEAKAAFGSGSMLTEAMKAERERALRLAIHSVESFRGYSSRVGQSRMLQVQLVSTIKA
jgi:CHAD domain-containing protein